MSSRFYHISLGVNGDLGKIGTLIKKSHIKKQVDKKRVYFFVDVLFIDHRL